MRPVLSLILDSKSLSGHFKVTKYIVPAGASLFAKGQLL